MTKYVLCGGFPALARDNGQAFIATITSGLDEPSVLFCGFAQPETAWESKRIETEQFFSGWSTISKPVALAQHDLLLDQIASHTIIYLGGGNTPQLYKAFADYSKDPGFWRERFAGKVIAGSSAGVNLLTAMSYNVDHHILQYGLGIIQQASLVHYRSTTYNQAVSWDDAEVELKNKTDLPILRLKEGEFITLNI